MRGKRGAPCSRCRSRALGRYAQCRIEARCGSPKVMTRVWVSCRRRPPIYVLQHLHNQLEEQARVNWTLAVDLQHQLWLRPREPETLPQGFLEVRERDGPGSLPRDARWRLGKARLELGGGNQKH